MKYWFIGGGIGYAGFVSERPERIQGLIDAFVFMSEGDRDAEDFTVTAFQESDMLDRDKYRSVHYNKLADLFIQKH